MGVPHSLRKPKGNLKICILLFLINLVILSHAWLFLEAWLTAFKCSCGVAVPTKNEVQLQELYPGDRHGATKQICNICISQQFLFYAGNMRNLTLRCFMRREKAEGEQGKEKKDSYLSQKIGESSSWEKNKQNLTATAVLMKGWEGREGRLVFISQSW